MSELNKKLSKIQKELKAPKSQFNKFGNYSYRSCEDIMEAVKPLLGDLTLLVFDKVVQVGDRYYIEATAELGDGENIIKTTAYAREADTKKGMDESQITGSASSYARKYALNGLFAIDDTKDADTQDNTTETKKEQTGGKTITSAQVGMIGGIANKELGWSNLKLSKVLAMLYKKSDVTTLTVSEASDFITRLQKEVEKQQVREETEIDIEEISKVLDGGVDEKE